MRTPATSAWICINRSFRDTPPSTRSYCNSNPHSPGNIRAIAPLRNVDAWYAAFGVTEGDANYLKPEERVRIW